MFEPIEKKLRVPLAWMMALLANVICGWVILPVLQHGENSHTSNKDLATAGFCIAAFAILGLALFHAKQKKENVLVWPAMLTAYSFLFWAWKICHLYCEGCAHSG